MGEIQRLIMDGRMPNCFFLAPNMEQSFGDDLARMQMPRDRLLEMAKSDLSDHFHRYEALAALREFFGLRGVSAEFATRRRSGRARSDRLAGTDASSLNDASHGIWYRARNSSRRI